MAIELNCPKCHNNRFVFPKTDEEDVRCQICGTSIGTYAELKEQVSNAITNRLNPR